MKTAKPPQTIATKTQYCKNSPTHFARLHLHPTPMERAALQEHPEAGMVIHWFALNGIDFQDTQS